MGEAMTTHELKIAPQWFKEVDEGRKKAEVRRFDRDYRVGDLLILREWEDEYTRRETAVEITHILHEWDTSGLKADYCVISFRRTVTLKDLGLE